MMTNVSRIRGRSGSDQDALLASLYQSMKHGGIIDIVAMEDSGISEMKKFIYKHAKSGDRLRLHVDVSNPRGKNSQNSQKILTEAIFVESGSSVPRFENNIFLPFEGGESESSSDEVKYVNISDTEIKFEHDTVTVDNNPIEFGQPFVLDGRRVVLAQGSVVLIIEDSLTKAFPQEGVQDEVLENEGTLALGDIVTTGVNDIGTAQVALKQASGETSVISYVFVYDTVTGQRTCVAKKSNLVDFSGTKGSASGSSNLDLWNGEGTLENVFQYSASAVTIRSVDTTNAAIDQDHDLDPDQSQHQSQSQSVATFDINGMSFGSDDSAVILGKDGQFRIKYDEFSDTVQIQFLDTSLGEYVTKREFGR